MKGFSLLEIIFVIAIIGILTAIGVNSFQEAQLKKHQQAIIQNIISNLEKAKADTQAGKDGTQHGIKFNIQDFVLFSGSSFDSSNSSNVVIGIHSQFEIETTLTNTQKIITFSRLYGDPNETATISVSHIDDRLNPIVFSIDTVGSISMVE